ncbi:transcriptional regulator [Aliidiomarina minuta]|uniref:Transcriptional regulator n=1 Tax=Aliidiomarina minuta TaxID=880057 RepID=A0A432W8C7_9GAMM|nr:metalloregulator ArsR/SmtB family transcription factor [Aliidiomarina minuta]RUO26312.1 transcriptional regulator [Aliidiomarina minuta]
MQTAHTLKILGDETRLQIMLLLAAEEELCVCELVAALDQLQPKISRHIRLLKDAGLICDRRQGQWMFYRWSSDLPVWVSELLHNLRQHDLQLLQQGRANLAAMNSRPERCC